MKLLNFSNKCIHSDRDGNVKSSKKLFLETTNAMVLLRLGISVIAFVVSATTLGKPTQYYILEVVVTTFTLFI